MGEFVAKRISEMSRAKTELNNYDKRTSELLGQVQMTQGLAHSWSECLNLSFRRAQILACG